MSVCVCRHVCVLVLMCSLTFQISLEFHVDDGFTHYLLAFEGHADVFMYYVLDVF